MISFQHTLQYFPELPHADEAQGEELELDIPPVSPPSGLFHPQTTLEEWREELIDSHATQNITVDRVGNERSLLENALSWYKKSHFTMRAIPNVVFAGEMGLDDGGPRREFFSLAVRALTTARIDGMCLFDGEDGYKLPSESRCLADSGIFVLVGKLIAHSVLHGSHGPVGLSPAIQHVLVYADMDENPPPFDKRDLPFELREMVEEVSLAGADDCYSIHGCYYYC